MNSVLQVLESRGAGLHGMVLRVTLRTEVAEELMQELFVKLSLSSGFAKADDPGAYARRVAINLAMDWRRARMKKRRVGGLDVEPVGKVRGPAELVEESDEVERVLDAAMALSELAREAFVLHYIEQETYERVGELLGKTAHQARGICHAAVVQVREKLGGRQVKHESVE
jgi:RNA polymerase sigma factor (sigma-70 family)